MKLNSFKRMKTKTRGERPKKMKKTAFKCQFIYFLIHCNLLQNDNVKKWICIHIVVLFWNCDRILWLTEKKNAISFATSINQLASKFHIVTIVYRILFFRFFFLSNSMETYHCEWNINLDTSVLRADIKKKYFQCIWLLT